MVKDPALRYHNVQRLLRSMGYQPEPACSHGVMGGGGGLEGDFETED